ncbi:hypothetical protein IFM12275_65990 [Nocardia sputorum]|uniref:hypothetical protein n=1 Tax=Nocardia sputorum TaxID=2984338 RepID=UPI0024909E47|nr:hypothetical protein [Nocardia sputorum]BDT96623.1 hypothetical protein IFM12275_65990 [Nocardia sputorum]
MNYDAQAEAEIDVLTDVLATLDNAAKTAIGRGLDDAARLRLFAVVLYELIISARSIACPEAGQLYAAPILDPIIEGLVVADEVTAMDLLIPALLHLQAPP